VKVGNEIKITDPSISFSPCYCAPEWASFVLQEKGPTIVADPFLDVWSVGCCVCELVTFEPILKGKYAGFVAKCRSHREAGFFFMEWLSKLDDSQVPAKIAEFDVELAQLVSEYLLVPRKDARKSCAEALSHSYLIAKTSDAVTVSTDTSATHAIKEMPLVSPTVRGKREHDDSTVKVHTGTLWKLNTGKDPRQNEEWLQRDMWINENGSLCYFSQKENKKLVLVDMQYLKGAEIEAMDGCAKEHALVINCDAGVDDHDGKVFVFAADSADDLETWIHFLRSATVDAMPSVHNVGMFVEEMKTIKVKNRRGKVDTEYKQQYEPVWKSTLWKVKGAGDRTLEEHWFEREVWLSKNGSLVYWSHKEHRELIYYTTEDVLAADVKLINDHSFKPWAFQVCLPAADGVKFAPGEFAAETEEIRDLWLSKWASIQKAAKAVS